MKLKNFKKSHPSVVLCVKTNKSSHLALVSASACADGIVKAQQVGSRVLVRFGSFRHGVQRDEAFRPVPTLRSVLEERAIAVACQRNSPSLMTSKASDTQWRTSSIVDRKKSGKRPPPKTTK